MKEHTKKYKKIVDELVEKSFPSLKSKKIKFFEFGITNFYGLFIPMNFIGLHKKCRSFSNKIIKGILVHELCHAEFSNKGGFVKSWLTLIFYWFFSKLRAKEEIKTDKLAIKKGYGRELFESARKIELDLDRKDVRYGLSPEQIKNYAKKIRKW